MKILFLILFFWSPCNSHFFLESPEVIDEEARKPLYLTDYLMEGNIAKALEAAAVEPFLDYEVSFSGLLTTDEDHNSHTFFWYFRAESDGDSAPIIVWLQGGPGASSLYGLFLENGPYRIHPQGRIHRRHLSWTESYHMLYIDNPVGTGFSSTDGEEGYATDQEQIASTLLNALKQFFLMFPELRDNDLYLAGESYAGKYIPSLGRKIHEYTHPDPDFENFINSTDVGLSDFNLNLKGFCIGNGFVDPVNQLEYGDFLYQIGLIGDEQRTEFQEMEEKVRLMIESQNWTQAYSDFGELIGFPGISLFSNFTGYHNMYNFLNTHQHKFLRQLEMVDKFLSKKWVKRRIHVGDLPFQNVVNPKVSYFLKDDFVQSVAPSLEFLLDQGYRVLLYNGQMDIVEAFPLTENYAKKLNWCGSENFNSSERLQWYVKCHQLAGYIQSVKSSNCEGTLDLVMVRNAGHMVPIEQPQWAYELYRKFTSNTMVDVDPCEGEYLSSEI